MTNEQRIWVDLMKTDSARRLVLTTRGTLDDLRKNGVELREGLVLKVYTDDLDDAGNPDNLVTEGIVRYDAAGNRWVLEIDWSSLAHESEKPVQDERD